MRPLSSRSAGCARASGGLCFVRAREGDEVVLTTYGRSSGFCVDPIEKKPLNHFLPGTAVLLVRHRGLQPRLPVLPELGHLEVQGDGHARRRGVAGGDRPGRRGPRLPQRRLHLQRPGRSSWSTRSTWPTPATSVGIEAVAVTAGYICPEPRARVLSPRSTPRTSTSRGSPRTSTTTCASAARAGARDARVPQARDRTCWFEITTLLIPGLNDSNEEIDAHDRAGSSADLGPDVPMHFTRLPPGLPDAATARRRPPRPSAAPAGIALANGVRYAYTGNVRTTSEDRARTAMCVAIE